MSECAVQLVRDIDDGFARKDVEARLAVCAVPATPRPRWILRDRDVIGAAPGSRAEGRPFRVGEQCLRRTVR